MKAEPGANDGVPISHLLKSCQKAEWYLCESGLQKTGTRVWKMFQRPLTGTLHVKPHEQSETQLAQLASVRPLWRERLNFVDFIHREKRWEEV